MSSAPEHAVEHYRLGPFLLASELPLPELEPLANPTDAELFHVAIRLAPVPERIDGVVANESQWWSSRTEYLQRVPNVGNFLVRNGREVLVEAAPGVPPENVRAYLLSPIFSILCYQAGIFSLHASSVRVGDGVVAFVGDSGAGKSTLVASLAQRGFTVISDDMCLLDNRANDNGLTQVIPVAPAIKLWRSALEQLGGRTEAHPRVFSGDDKYRIRLSQPLPFRLPLRQVLFLEWANQDDRQPTIAPVEGVEALTRLMEFTLHDYLMKPTGRQSGNFQLCGRILSHASAYALRRPRNFAQHDATLATLEAHLARLQNSDFSTSNRLQ